MAAKKSLVALNIGSQRVTMGVFSPGPKGTLVLRKYSSAELIADPSADPTRPAQVGAAVRELAEKLKVRREGVRYAIPGRSTIIKFVSLPPLGEEKVDQIIGFEAAQNVPFPIEEVIWDYQLVGEDKDAEVEVVIVAVKSEVLDELNHGVEAAPLRTEVVDASPLALFNAFRFNYGDVQEPALLVDIGARSFNLIYIERGRIFVRNTTSVGGATISQAIAKEFGVEFAEAEARKIKDGIVSLGSAYEDHPDPEIAAISKVIRNTLTRLHAEIVRTTNQHRGQGGSAPQRVLLCGGTAGLGYIREFFEEKLKIPVEFFNPLRNVSVASGVDVETASKEAHRLGEIVGLGLRGIGSCPMELDLVPHSVQRGRDVTARRPFLITAAAVAFLTLLAAIFYFTNATAATERRLAEQEDVKTDLSGWERKISAVRSELAEDQARGSALEQAVIRRTYWQELLGDLNARLPSDMVWLSSIEPLSGSESLTGTTRPTPGAQSRSEEQEAAAGKITALRVRGLYRDEPGGFEDASRYLDEIAKSPFFNLPDLAAERTKYVTRLETSGTKTKWAWEFEFLLPLNTQISYE